MNIVILSSHNPYKNSGLVSLDLYRNLKKFPENEVRLIVREWGQYPDKDIISIESYYDEMKRRIIHFFRRVINKAERTLFGRNILINKRIDTNINYHVQGIDQNITYYKTKKFLKIIKFKPDVFIVLISSYFLSFRNLYEFNHLTQSPVYLYLMDMALMTGGCHYAWNCKGYLYKCGNCPAMYSNMEIDQSRLNWQLKKKYIELTNITAIAASEGQFKQLKESSLFRNIPKKKILIGLNPELFKPSCKKEARSFFNLPQSKKIIFFGAVNIFIKRKGFSLLLDALNHLSSIITNHNEVFLVIAGFRNKEFETKLPFAHKFIGSLPFNELAKAFQATDLFVSPSIEDSGPMMINQSIMCGTPVVAFDIGVAPDLVVTGETGYLAELGNAEDLANGIQYFLRIDESKIAKINENCRVIGLKLCHPQIQASSFMELFVNNNKNYHGNTIS